MGKLNTACENIHAYIIDCSPDNTVDAGRVIILCCKKHLKHSSHHYRC